MSANATEAAEQARRLAQQASREGWQGISAVVDRKCWLAQWQPAIAALAGELDDPAPLVALLADAGKDDYFRHRLAVAAACLPRVAPKRRPWILDMINGITTTAIGIWAEHERLGTTPVVPHLTDSLPHLAEVNGLVEDRPLLAWACRQLVGGDWQAAEHAFYHMASAAARPQVAEALIGLIRERQACPRVFRVLLRLGSFAATPAVLEVLREAVTDPHADSAVLASAVTLLGRLNDASPAVLSALLRFCLDRDHGTTVPSAAAEALVLLGASASTEEVLEPLIQALQNPYADRQVQKRAIAVLGGMGPAAATAPVLGALARLAQSEDTPGDLSREAQGALERIHGSAVGEPTEAAPCETPDGLDTRSSASGQAPTGGLRAEGVSDAGRSAAGDTAPGREETTQQRQSQEDLRKALEDPDWRVSNAAGWRLLENAQEPDLLAEAVRHMIFQWGYVFDERLTAGSTIGSLGALARRRPEVIAEVVPKLGPAMEVVVSAFGMEEVRSAAVDAITQRTACGVRLFRRGQAVWEALRVEELSG